MMPPGGDRMVMYGYMSDFITINILLVIIFFQKSCYLFSKSVLFENMPTYTHTLLLYNKDMN